MLTNGELTLSDGIAGFLLGLGVFAWVIGIAIALVAIACTWKLFTLAGKPGWFCIIPIFNSIVLCQIVFGEKRWWVLLLASALAFIPFIGPLLSTALFAYTNYCTAMAFGQSPIMGILHCFFSPWTMLIWVLTGSAKYMGVQPMFF